MYMLVEFPQIQKYMDGLYFSVTIQRNGVHTHSCKKQVNGMMTRVNLPTWFLRLKQNIQQIHGMGKFGRCPGYAKSHCVCYRKRGENPWRDSTQVVYCTGCLGITCRPCMSRLVTEFQGAIQRRRARGVPLEAVSDDQLSLNVCQSCLTGYGLNGITLLDHPTVRISNIFGNETEMADLVRKHNLPFTLQ